MANPFKGIWEMVSALGGIRTAIQGKKTYIVLAIALINMLAEFLDMTVSWADGGMSTLLFGQQAWQLWLTLAGMTFVAKVNRAANSK